MMRKKIAAYHLVGFLILSALIFFIDQSILLIAILGVLTVINYVISNYVLHSVQKIERGKNFIANASHELRTPITIVRGFAETLQDNPALSKEMVEEITDKIVRTCIRMEKLIKSLILLSDIEYIPEDRLQAADLIAIVQTCREYLLTLHPEATVAIETTLSEAPVFVDVDLIEMAVSNLLENAVKYSEGDAKIAIRIDRVNGKIRLEIQDNGIGISEEDLPHVFERFYAVDKARSRKAGGAGLGLSITKKVVEKHKGKITVSSSLSQGSIFTIVLPLKGCKGCK